VNIYHYTTPLILQKDRPTLEEKPVRKPSFFRVFWISWNIFKLVVRYFFSKFSKRITPQARAIEVRQFLEKMGGMWIKVGQVLAMRTDIFALEFCSELSRLQDRSITFPAKRSLEIIEENLGRPISEVFESFQEAPFAAASLSQVHKARLRETGEWVVVKVQRPYALDYFHYDFRWLSFFARLLKLLGIMKHFRLDSMLEVIREMMEEELDYRHEASNMRRLKKVLQQHRIMVPTVSLKYTTERILVMEYLDGVFMSDYVNVHRNDPARASAWLAENDIEPAKVARRLFQSVMRQLYEDLLFHADLHPGNIVLLKGNRLAFIDFGNCGRIDKKFAAQYEQYFRAMSEHALDKAADLLLLTMGKLPPMDVNGFKKQVIKIFEKQIARSYIQNLPYRERSMGSSSAELNQIMAEYKIEVNWDMLKMARAFESVDQNISVLNPDFNFTREMQKYQTKAKMRKKWIQLQMLPNMLEQIANFSQIILPSMLERSLSMGGGISKGIQIAAAIFGIIKKVLIVGMIAGIWTYLHQHQHQLIGDFHNEENDLLTNFGVSESLQNAPRLTVEFWFTGVLVLLVVIIQIGRFTKKLLKPEDSLPGQRR
jgi:ubiquinone biosynthesis protein